MMNDLKGGLNKYFHTLLFYKFDFKMISFFHTTMDQLCEPLEVNRKFIKMIEEVIQPEYERVLKDIFELLKQDIDLKSTTTIHGFSAET